jgi:hypothetical protein
MEIPKIKVNDLLVNVFKALYKGYGKHIVYDIPALNPSVKRKGNSELPANNKRFLKRKKVYVVVEKDCEI